MALVAGRYELGRLLGSGGFASVFRAHDIVAARDVALKLIPLEETAERFERFRQEALLTSRLRSRHVARVYDFGKDPEVGAFLVMEVVDGVHLDIASIGRALLPHEVLRVARCLLDALADAHNAGLIHCDVKPSNVIVPKGKHSLDDVRVLDFGIAQSLRRRELNTALGIDRPDGTVLGTPAFMAPEQLARGVVGPAADVYAAGLVLFDLLGHGPLFPGDTLREQLVARLTQDADIDERVPPPLGLLLSRMLMRDPLERFANASEALSAIGDLETAPVALSSLFAPLSVPPNGPVTESRPPMPTLTTSDDHPSESRQRSSPPRPGFAFGTQRLSRLAEDPIVALRETLQALDLPMTDALARRERGAEIGRIARALTLTFRLELDAAAVVLEPLVDKSVLARALGMTLIASRGRKGTRARVEHDRTDMWLDAIDPELAAMLASVAAAMTSREDAARNELRTRRAADRLPAPSAAAITARMAQVTMASIAGAIPSASAIAELRRLRESDPTTTMPFHGTVRALLLGVAAFREDEHLARQQLERAAKLAVQYGTPLLEVRATAVWAGMLVEVPSRIEQGLAILERATTLLAHGDLPSLEHMTEHNRGAALFIQGRHQEAALHLSRARVAARGELSRDHEMQSCANETMCHIFVGVAGLATQTVAELEEARMSEVSPRTAAYAYTARSLYQLVFGTLDQAASELRRATVRAQEAESNGRDVILVTELLSILYAAGRGEAVDLLSRAGELEKLAHDHGFASFYWMENLRCAVLNVRDPALREPIQEALERLEMMLGPINQAAMER